MNAASITADTHAAIRLRILAECRSEQTEAYVFAQLAGFDELFGAGRDVIDAVIDSMLEAGELRSSVIDARRVGFGYLPTLTAA